MEPPDEDLPYALLARLGRGAYGEVWEAEAPDGSRVAVKRLQVPTAQRARVAREIATLRQLRIPGVVPFVDARLDTDRAWIAMELVRGAPFPGAFGAGDDGVPVLVAWEARRRSSSPSASALRAPLQEARAEEVVRWVQLRRGDPVPPDPARVVAVRALGRPRLVALAALTEARLALAAGAQALARDLAGDALDAGDAAVVPEDMRLCAEAVLAAAGGSVDLPRLVAALDALAHTQTRDEAMGYLRRAHLLS